jgi:hypothetical protein
MASHVASRALSEFPSGCKHEMVVERASKLYPRWPGVSESMFLFPAVITMALPPTTVTLAMGEQRRDRSESA